MFTGKEIDQAVNGIEWKSNFHKEIAHILMNSNSRITSEKQLLHNVNVINSLDQGEITSLSLTEIMNRGFYYSGI